MQDVCHQYTAECHANKQHKYSGTPVLSTKATDILTVIVILAAECGRRGSGCGCSLSGPLLCGQHDTLPGPRCCCGRDTRAGHRCIRCAVIRASNDCFAMCAHHGVTARSTDAARRIRCCGCRHRCRRRCSPVPHDSPTSSSWQQGTVQCSTCPRGAWLRCRVATPAAACRSLHTDPRLRHRPSPLAAAATTGGRCSCRISALALCHR